MASYLTNIWILIITGVLSLAVLVISANIAVVKFTGLANFFRLSTTFVGVTVVSLATSIPEIASHYTASVGILSGVLDYRVSSAVVLGANIGSDVIQQTLILGMVIFIAGTLHFKRYFLWKSMIPMIGTTLMCIILGVDGTYSRLDGAILFGTFFLYMIFLYYDEKKYYKAEENGYSKDGEPPENTPRNGKEAWQYLGVALLAMAATILSAMFTLQITEVIVARTGLGGSMLGVITLGIASALPEMTTALSGIRNGDSGIPLGTLVGSNITNPLVAIGGGALISTYWVPDALVRWDLPWEALTGALLWVILWFNKGDAGKKTAIYLTLLYFVFVTLRAIFFGTD